MFYYDILKEFHDKSVRYLIVGGLSVNLHGIPRVTQDIDFVIAMDTDNIYRVIKVMKELDYIPVIPVDAEGLADADIRQQWISEKNLIAFSFRHQRQAYRTIDILLVHPLNFDDAYKRKVSRVYRDSEIDIVSIDDLIIMKKFSSRSQDLSDIKMLNKLKVFLGKADGE
ncbi:MAG TPA: hypothetical protein PK986_07995 [Spirochaetota bacterium]|nr:hypothetical protein [Spirochaetota bacterium]